MRKTVANPAPVPKTMSMGVSFTPDAYITSDQLKASLNLQGQTYADADIELAILAASQQINEQCNRRTFSLDGSSSVRLYRPVGRLIDMDDAVEVDTVAIGPGDGTFPTTLTVGTDYEVQPLNALADGQPLTMIKLRRYSNYWGTYGYGFQRNWQVQITGTFGWPEVPSLVLSATSLLAGRIVRRIREAPFGVIQLGLDGQTARIAQTDPDICSMLTPVTKFLVR